MPADCRFLLFLRPLLLAFIFFFSPGVASTDTLDEGARALARRIVASLGARTTLALTVRNLSSLPAAEVPDVRRALEAELESNGARMAGDRPAQAEVQVTLSENVQGYLWVAEIRRGESREVVMLVVERRPSSGSARPAATWLMEKSLVWEQELPILDLVVLGDGDPRRIVVLDPAKVAFHEKRGEGWVMWQVLPLPASKPWPRDLRGRLVVEGDFFSAYLPGLVCAGAARRGDSAEPGMDCAESDDPWPLQSGRKLFGHARFAPGRNFFDGRWTTEEGAVREVAPFFSVAGFAAQEQFHWVFAGVDGRVRLREGPGHPAETLDGWGSDLAGIETPCGGGWQVLATRAGDEPGPDAVQAFEIRDGQGVAVTGPVEFPGPITALWPVEGGAHALAVSRNLKTSRYEAHILSLACGR